MECKTVGVYRDTIDISDITQQRAFDERLQNEAKRLISIRLKLLAEPAEALLVPSVAATVADNVQEAVFIPKGEE